MMVPSEPDDEIGRPPQHLAQHVQSAPFTATFGAHPHHVAGTVTYERLRVGAKSRHHGLAELTHWCRSAFAIQYLQDDALAHKQDLPCAAIRGR